MRLQKTNRGIGLLPKRLALKTRLKSFLDCVWRIYCSLRDFSTYHFSTLHFLLITFTKQRALPKTLHASGSPGESPAYWMMWWCHVQLSEARYGQMARANSALDGYGAKQEEPRKNRSSAEDHAV